MAILIKNLIKLATLTSGRRLLALRRMRPEAVAMHLLNLVAFIDAAIAHEKKTRGLETRWLALRKATNMHSPKASALGGLIARLITGIRDAAYLYALGADEAAEAEVERFVEEVFPAGVFAVTTMQSADKAAEVSRIVDLLQGPLAPQVAHFGLTYLVERLATTNDAYRDALYVDEPVDFATVREAREQGQDMTRQIVAQVMGMYPLDTPEHLAARDRLLGSIMQQDAAVREYRRSRRSVPDVDPDSGDVDEPTADTDELDASDVSDE